MRLLAVLTLTCGLGLGLQPAIAQSPAGTEKAFCTEATQSGQTMRCTFDTMAQCEATAQGTTKCVANPKMAQKQ